MTLLNPIFILKYSEYGLKNTALATVLLKVIYIAMEAERKHFKGDRLNE